MTAVVVYFSWLFLALLVCIFVYRSDRRRDRTWTLGWVLMFAAGFALLYFALNPN